MSTSTPFTLKIFVADGDPDGLRLVERSNWNGKAVVFPRTLLPTVKKREEFNQTGVYILVGPRENGEGEMVYIGEGDPVGKRLEDHYSRKDFWTQAVFFVAGPGQLNKAHVKFLEAQLIQLAQAARRVTLDNGRNESDPTLSEADRADMKVFLDNMLGMLPVLGIHAFEMPQDSTASDDRTILYCTKKGIKASGYESTKGFVIKAGSQAAGKVGTSCQTGHIRQELLESGVLKVEGEKLLFTQDYAFSAPSVAADVVLGRASNGRIEWKDENGITLRELQERAAGID